MGSMSTKYALHPHSTSLVCTLQQVCMTPTNTETEQPIILTCQLDIWLVYIAQFHHDRQINGSLVRTHTDFLKS